MEMASALRGEAAAIPEIEEVHDVLREVASMVAGGLLYRLDPEAKVSLQLPRVLGDARQWDPGKGIAMDLDGRTLLAQLSWPQ